MGLKLLPTTYRPSEDDARSVHMTDFDRDKFVTIATNSPRPIGGKIESVNTASLTRMLKLLEHDIQTLSKHRVKMPSIAYFASLPRGGGRDVNVTVVMGDLDYYIEFDSEDTEDACLQRNLKEVKGFLDMCLSRRINNSEEQARVQGIIDSWYEETKKAEWRLESM